MLLKSNLSAALSRKKLIQQLLFSWVYGYSCFIFNLTSLLILVLFLIEIYLNQEKEMYGNVNAVKCEDDDTALSSGYCIESSGGDSPPRKLRSNSDEKL